MGRRRALEGLVDKVNNDLVGEHRRRAAIREKVWREGRGGGGSTFVAGCNDISSRR